MIDGEMRSGANTRRVALGGAALVAVLILALSGARPAAAFVSHKLDSSFPTTGINAPTTVAVDEETGSVYVLDLFSGKIGKFTANGEPANFSALGTNLLQAICTNQCNQIAVDNSGGPNQGVIYVSSNVSFESGSAARKVLVYLPSGKEAEGIQNQTMPYSNTRFCGVATDPTEHVYVAHNNGLEPGRLGVRGSAHIHRFKPGKWLPTGVSPEHQVWPITGVMWSQPQELNGFGGCRVASSSEGDMYYSEFGEGFGGLLTKVPVFRSLHQYFDVKPGPPLTKVDAGSTYFAIDESNNDGYYDHETSIVRRNQEGVTLETIAPIGLSLGVAVNSDTGTVYVSDAEGGKVRIFTPTVSPDVSYGQPAAGATGASLSGTIGTAGAGNVTDCKFEYGTTEEYSTVEQCTPDAAGTPFNADTAVTASPSGLSQETTYHYRITASNSNGTTQGPDQTFTTHNVPDLSTGAATEITQTTATLNGSWTGTGGAVDYTFEWGPTTSYGHVATGSSAEVGPVSVSEPISGLVADTPDTPEESPGLYHYRIVATGSLGTTVGADRTFTTAAPLPPQISSVIASDVTATGATLSAQINPNLGATFYLYEYGPSRIYSANTPTSLIGDDNTDHAAVQSIGGLEPGTTYHFRVVATNFGGTTLGPDQSFTTGGSAFALAEPGAVSGPLVRTGSAQSAPSKGPGSSKNRCRHGRVKRAGKCVRRKTKRHRHQRTRRTHG